MAPTFSVEQAKAMLDTGLNQAQELIQEPSKVKELLAEFEEKLRTVPVIGESLADIPLMAAMIKSYITREYTDVSPKVIALMVSAVLYLVKKKDIVPDSIPLLGFVDDIAVLGLAIKLCEAELAAFSQWREETKTEEEIPDVL